VGGFRPEKVQGTTYPHGQVQYRSFPGGDGDFGNGLPKERFLAKVSIASVLTLQKGGGNLLHLTKAHVKGVTYGIVASSRRRGRGTSRRKRQLIYAKTEKMVPKKATDNFPHRTRGGERFQKILGGTRGALQNKEKSAHKARRAAELIPVCQGFRKSGSVTLNPPIAKKRPKKKGADKKNKVGVALSTKGTLEALRNLPVVCIEAIAGSRCAENSKALGR